MEETSRAGGVFEEWWLGSYILDRLGLGMVEKKILYNEF